MKRHIFDKYCPICFALLGGFNLALAATAMIDDRSWQLNCFVGLFLSAMAFIYQAAD